MIQVNPKIEAAWKEKLKNEFESEYFKQIKATLITEYESYSVYPPKKKIFSAYDLCPFDQVKVVILGQDPYHGKGQAHGLAFSIPKDLNKKPPSLKNIIKEVSTDCQIPAAPHGNLDAWAAQGVFLLNSYLSVREGKPLSHAKIGWEKFTDASIQKLSEDRENLVFMLWGSFARKKKSLIDETKHLILESVHPSPLSAHRGFMGCKHFSKCNTYLRSKDISPIDWEIK